MSDPSISCTDDVKFSTGYNVEPVKLAKRLAEPSTDIDDSSYEDPDDRDG